MTFFTQIIFVGASEKNVVFAAIMVVGATRNRTVKKAMNFFLLLSYLYLLDVLHGCNNSQVQTVFNHSNFISCLKEKSSH